MNLDSEHEFAMEIDENRSVTAVPTADRATMVLTLEDAHSVAVVEFTEPEFRELVDGLIKIKEIMTWKLP